MKSLFEEFGVSLEPTRPVSLEARRSLLHMGTLREPGNVAVKFLCFVALAALAISVSSPAQGQSVTFSDSNGGDNYFVFIGDSWVINIAGAAASSEVSACSNMYGGGCENFGMTDVYGNWPDSGTIPEGTEGVWYETWYVGGSVAGYVNFDVLPSCTPAADPLYVSFYSIDYRGGGSYLGSAYASPQTLDATVQSNCLMGGASLMGDGRLNATTLSSSSSYYEVEFGDAGYTGNGLGFDMDQGGIYNGSVVFYSTDTDDTRDFSSEVSATLSVEDC